MYQEDTHNSLPEGYAFIIGSDDSLCWNVPDDLDVDAWREKYITGHYGTWDWTGYIYFAVLTDTYCKYVVIDKPEAYYPLLKESNTVEISPYSSVYEA